jgi:hypothetical protein
MSARRSIFDPIRHRVRPRGIIQVKLQHQTDLSVFISAGNQPGIETHPGTIKPAGHFADGRQFDYPRWVGTPTRDFDVLLFVMEGWPHIYHRFKRPLLQRISARGEQPEWIKWDDLDSSISRVSVPEAIHWFEHHGLPIPDAAPFNSIANHVTDADSADGKHRIRLCWRLAHQSLERAMNAQNRPAHKPLTKVWEWLKENDPDEYDLPDFNTWCRYIREYKHAASGAVNTSRAGRTGRSIVTREQL